MHQHLRAGLREGTSSIETEADEFCRKETNHCGASPWLLTTCLRWSKRMECIVVKGLTLTDLVILCVFIRFVFLWGNFVYLLVVLCLFVVILCLFEAILCCFLGKSVSFFCFFEVILCLFVIILFLLWLFFTFFFFIIVCLFMVILCLFEVICVFCGLLCSSFAVPLYLFESLTGWFLLIWVTFCRWCRGTLKLWAPGSVPDKLISAVRLCTKATNNTNDKQSSP